MNARDDALRAAIAAGRRGLALARLPPSARARLLASVHWAHDLLASAEAGDAEEVAARVEEMDRIFPRWARGSAQLEALFTSGAVAVDEQADPVAVVVHWERLPGKPEREAAASLASELVDAYRNRPVGGRPKK